MQTLTLLTFISTFALTMAVPHLPASTPLIQRSQPKDPTTQVGEKMNDTATLEHQIGALLAHDAIESYNPNTCPLSHKSKQCCTSVTSLADQLTEPLEEAVPLIKGLEISSIIGLQCKPMQPEEQNSDCLSDVMCCDGDLKADDLSLFKSSCVPYKQAIADKRKAIEKNKQEAHLAELQQQQQQQQQVQSSSSSTPSSASRVGGVVATPVPTKI